MRQPDTTFWPLRIHKVSKEPARWTVHHDRSKGARVKNTRDLCVAIVGLRIYQAVPLNQLEQCEYVET